jgi:hypothetical protein
MALPSPSRIPSASPSAPHRVVTNTTRCLANLLPWSCSPLRRSQPGESTSRQTLAKTQLPKKPNPRSYLPRRGLPKNPLRSAFAVSHDLDGLRLPEPGDLFQPLTPLGLVLPAPGPRPKPRCRTERRLAATNCSTRGWHPCERLPAKTPPRSLFTTRLALHRAHRRNDGSGSGSPVHPLPTIRDPLEPGIAPRSPRRVGHRTRSTNRCQPASPIARSAETKRTRPEGPSRGCLSRKVMT